MAVMTTGEAERAEVPSTGRRLLQLGRRILEPWVRFWQRVEGAELEPPIWHSHYLSVRVLNAGLGALCRDLSGRVLDIGAGTGFGGRFLDAARTSYIPTDLPSGRDPADPVISKTGVKPSIICSGYALPLRRGRVDAIMAISLFEHVENPRAMLDEVARVLASSGKLVVAVPFCFPVHGAPDDFWRWTPQGLEREIERAGFRVERTVMMGNGIHSMAVNFNFLLRYHLGAGSVILNTLLVAARPFVLVSQLLVNTLALTLAPLNRSDALPLAVGLVAVKAAPPAGLAAVRCAQL